MGDVSPLMVLYICARRECFLRVSNVSHSSVFTALVRQPGSLERQLVTNRAALFCTPSNCKICFCRCGSQAVLAYSSVGLIKALYACAFTSLGH